MGVKIDLDKLKKELTPNEVINIIKTLEPDITYEEIPEALVFPTVCHNLDISSAKKKLYYYFNNDDSNPDASPLFCCYTECEGTFDIYELVRKMLVLRDLPAEFIDVFNIITRNTDKVFELEDNSDKYTSLLINYRRKNLDVNLNIFNEGVLKMFSPYAYLGWVEEGISTSTMHKYGIKFSISKNQIVIPHYDINGQLVGIRGRNLNEIDLLNGNKYMPIRIQGKWYSHSLSYNLYGLNFTKNAIQKKKMAFVFEGK